MAGFPGNWVAAWFGICVPWPVRPSTKFAATIAFHIGTMALVRSGLLHGPQPLDPADRS